MNYDDWRASEPEGQGWLCVWCGQTQRYGEREFCSEDCEREMRIGRWEELGWDDRSGWVEK